MKYSDLIQFDPIETVIQLHEAGDADRARHLVESFVISPDLAATLVDLAIPQLQFTSPADNKGLLVVGNYGTGKSHLMAVISAVAETADLAAAITNPEVREAATRIAGRFQVVRTEIGSTRMPLREILTGALKDRLKELGVAYTFPGADQVPNNKRCFRDMMAVFHERFPDQGLLLVVDELLDFLRSRKDQELILDLNFLRELGESCADLRLRMLAGVQEAIFDSQRFAFAADSVRRVKDRFEQVLIARTDVQYVVAERLLKKTPEQRASIRQHLEPFGRLYGSLNEQLDDYVNLFPIHPDYIKTFERLAVVEKREVLKTFSLAMARMLDSDVPDAEPGLIAYDSYWETLTQNASFRALPEIRETMRCTEVLESRVRSAYTRPQYLPLAIRVIHALSVHRLTTGDIHASVGATTAELRDTLCLYQPGVEDLGGEPAEDLLMMVETVLRAIHRTVSGQFISQNPTNGQHYLDLGKTEDFDALLEARAESLDHSQLDRAYYRALLQLIDPLEDKPYVAGFQIWEHHLTWRERNTTRPGYLFFGAPNERSTAAPPRDFYLYFLQPFGPPRFRDERKPDEVFFDLKPEGGDFRELLARYAGADALMAQSSGAHKEQYRRKADEALQQLQEWLRSNMLGAFRVTSAGRDRTMKTWTKAGPTLRKRTGADPNKHIPFRDRVNAVAEICLDPHFRDTAPEYPTFGVLITKESREQAARDALAMVAGQRATRQAQGVLTGLELLDGEDVRPDTSRYARAILEILHAKPAGQVVSRDELLVETVRGVEYFDPGRAHLEPDWVVVLLAALVHSGHLVLTLPGRKFDALNLTELAATPLADLKSFLHLARPKDWNLPGITALVELVDLPPGVAKQVTQGRNEAVQQIQKAVARRVDALAKTLDTIQQGITLWGESLLGPGEMERFGGAAAGTKTFLESIAVLNTPAKFKNFRHDRDAVQRFSAGLEAVRDIEALRSLVARLQESVAWLSAAEAAGLPPEDPWLQSVRGARTHLLSRLRESRERNAPAFLPKVVSRLAELRKQYEDAYLKAHRRERLAPADAAHRDQLLRGDQVRTLSRLAAVSLLPRPRLIALEDRLKSLQECPGPTAEDLKARPVCPRCQFRPGSGSLASVKARLQDSERKLDELAEDWVRILRTNLEDPAVRESRALLSPEQQAEINAIVTALKTGGLPTDLDDARIRTLQTALSGIEKVTFTADEVQNRLFPGGSPATPDELRVRLDDYLRDVTKGRVQDRVRIVFE